MRAKLVLLFTVAACTCGLAQTYEAKPSGAYFEQFQPLAAPAWKGLALRRGDRLAICGDSITEQKMYSRLMEDYLTMCVPELKVTVRQYRLERRAGSGFPGAHDQ